MKRRKGPHPEDIKASIRKMGTTPRALSIMAGLDDGAISKSLTKPIPVANRIVAEFLGRPLHALWPQWYQPDGARIDRRKKASRKTSSGHCEKSASQ